MQAAISVIQSAIVAHYLGVRGLGEYGLAIAYVALFTGVVADWGVGTTALRQLAQHPADRDEIVTVAFRLQLGIALFTYVLLLAVGPLVTRSGGSEADVAIYGASILLTPVGLLLLPFQATLTMSRLVVPTIVTSLLNLGLVLVCARLRLPVTAVLGAAILSQTVRATWIVLLLGESRPHPSGSRIAAKSLLRDSWPLAIATTVQAALGQGPILALTRVGLSDIGIFNAANRVPAQLGAVPNAIRTSTFPVLAGYWAVDRVAFAQRLSDLLALSCVLSVAITTMTIALTPFITVTVFGSAFTAAELPMVLLTIGFGVGFPGVMVGEAMLAAGMQRLNLTILLVYLPVMIGLLALLVPSHGALGAAIAVLSVQLLLTLTVLVVGYVQFRISAALMCIVVLVICTALSLTIVAIVGQTLMTGILLVVAPTMFAAGMFRQPIASVAGRHREASS